LEPPDPTPPTFGGVESATALSSTEIELQWSEATDDVTPSSNIVYLIYMATTSGGQNFATPTAMTAPGVTAYTVTGLIPNTTYYFVVRARDEAGNIDANTVEKESTTLAAPTILVTNYTDNSVSVINGDTNAVLTVIPVGTGPIGIAVNLGTKRAYVANYGSSNVSVIDAATNTVVATVPTISADTPYGIAVNPNNNMIYVTEEYDYDIDYINGATNTVASILNVTSSYDFGIAINPNTNIAYVADWGDLYKIDTLTNVVVGGPIGGFGTSTSAFGVAVDPINNKVYVTDTSSTGAVDVLSTITDTIIATVSVGMDPEGVALHQTASRAYVANSGNNNVSVINTTTDTEVTTVNVGTFPMGVAVNQAANRAYVVNNGNNTVSVIDTTTNTVVDTIVVGAGPMGVAVIP
jgi:YVTN family beta-propeller protein